MGEEGEGERRRRGGELGEVEEVEVKVVRWKLATGEYGPECTKYKEVVVGKRLPKPQGRPPEAPEAPGARPQGPGEPPGEPPRKGGPGSFFGCP